METTYLIQKVEISARHLQGEANSETPNSWANKEFSWEDLNDIAHRMLEMIKNNYDQGFFKKLIVSITS